MTRLRDIYRRSLPFAGVFSPFSLGYFTTGEVGYLGFLAFPPFSRPRLAEKAAA